MRRNLLLAFAFWAFIAWASHANEISLSSAIICYILNGIWLKLCDINDNVR